jgi:hypothetical protein
LNFVFTALQVCHVVLGFVLLVFLLRGQLPKYLVLFLYSAIQQIITLIDIVLVREGRNSTRYKNIYWTEEIVWDLSMFLLVSVLIHRALEGRPEREFARKILILVWVTALVLPFVLFANHPMFRTPWFQGASQVLNFGAAILNLVLWGALIATRNRDRLLMLVSAGLGINVAGAAISWGLRKFAPQGSFFENAADVFAQLTYLAGLAIWCYAFMPKRKPAPPAK